jgi:hypothetical protein
MDDIDELMKRIGTGPVNPRLDGIEDAVFARIRANRAARSTGLGLAALAAVGAVILGAAGAGPASPAAAAPLGPIGIAGPLAPSTLLLAER